MTQGISEERLREIRALADLYDTDKFGAPYRVMHHALLEILAAYDSATEWRPVSEFVFPTEHGKDSGAVLVWDGNNIAVSHCTFYNGGSVTWWIDDSYGYNEDGEIYGVTHFKPLPTPPSKEKVKP